MNCVVIAGIKRSGSTALYNMVRLILQEAGYNVQIHGQDYKPRLVKGNKIDIVKTHPFNKQIAQHADHIFVTDRCDKGILQSLDRMWDSGDKERLSGMRSNLSKWMLYSDPDHFFHFDELRVEPQIWIRRASKVLDINADISDIERQFNAIQPPKDKQDPVTLLFPNHISDDYS